MVQYSSKFDERSRPGARCRDVRRRRSTRAADISGSTVAFLMPDQGSTRYEEHDHPGFIAEMKKLCPSCKVIYQNADADASQQQQQFNSVIAQGAKVIVLDPVDSPPRRRSSTTPRARASRSSPTTARSPTPRPTSTSRSTTGDRQGDRRVAGRASEGEGRVRRRRRGRAADQRLADRRGRGPDQEGHPRGTGHRPATRRWPSTTRRTGCRPRPSNGRPDRSRASARKIVGVVAANDGTGGGAIAAFKAAGVNPVPPVTGNDATIAALAAHHRRRPVQHDLQAERDRRAAPPPTSPWSS